MENQEKPKEINYSFFGIAMTKEQRLTHAIYMWCLSVLGTLLFTCTKDKESFYINEWFYFPTMLLSFALLEKVLPWYKEGFNLKSIFFNVIFFMVLNFTALCSIIMLYAVFCY